ncbi:MAG: GNAT family N-acetyltransferase [Chitinophagaceae bacterium]
MTKELDCNNVQEDDSNFAGGCNEQIVEYNPSMLDEMLRLFFNTVHTINARDYNKAQLENWAPEVIDKKKWEDRLTNNVCLVFYCENRIVGFGELSEEGGIDTLFVHKNFQGKRIASRLLEELTGYAQHHEFKLLTTEASITAKPFFEQHGFKVVEVQENHYQEIVFINYKMRKNIT